MLYEALAQRRLAASLGRITDAYEDLHRRVAAGLDVGFGLRSGTLRPDPLSRKGAGTGAEGSRDPLGSTRHVREAGAAEGPEGSEQHPRLWSVAPALRPERAPLPGLGPGSDKRTKARSPTPLAPSSPARPRNASTRPSSGAPPRTSTPLSTGRPTPRAPSATPGGPTPVQETRPLTSAYLGRAADLDNAAASYQALVLLDRSPVYDPASRDIARMPDSSGPSATTCFVPWVEATPPR